ncbi:MAG: hypothetical protein AAF799_25060 [Myxococcota bacterium]
MPSFASASMPKSGRVLLPGTVALVAALGPMRDAQAIDGTRIRTPVVWSDTPCMTIVDRSVDATLHIPYDIPLEDLDVTEDEVADGRRHQFIALCRDHDPTDILPGWLSEADVAAAEALGLIDLGTVNGDQILDLSTPWQGCFSRITDDDERRPISFASAEEGVDWDTTDLAPGAWFVEGFTHDPPLSIWSPRPGVVKVVDAPELDASGPAAAVLNGEEVVVSGEPVAIEGCISAMEGTVLDLSWVEVGESRWSTPVRGEVVRGTEFSIDLLLPPEMAGQSARVRIDAEDPTGRQTTAYMSEFVLVLPPTPGCDDDCTGTDGGDETSATDSVDDTGDTPSSTTGTDGLPADESGPNADTDSIGSAGSTAAGDDSSSGCACRAEPDRPWLGLAWLLPLAGLRLRRRHR